MSAKFSLVCDQATTFNFQFQILNDTTPWNLTGYTGTMTIRQYLNAPTATAVASTANGRMVFDNTNGRITVTLPSSVTSGFEPGRYVYDLIVDSGGTVTRLLEGKFVVTPAVTV